MAAKKGTWLYVTGKKYDGMMGRCYRTSDRSYSQYGEKGIKVCSSWIKDIQNFRTWLLNELHIHTIPLSEFIDNPKKYSLDRIDTNGHYEPNNCRLVNSQSQSRNTSNRNKKLYVSSEGEKIYV